MKELKVLASVEEIKELFDEGYEIIRLEIEEDGSTTIIQGDTSSKDFLFMKQLLEKEDYDYFGNVEDYKNWLNDNYRESIENGDYKVSIKFV